MPSPGQAGGSQVPTGAPQVPATAQPNVLQAEVQGSTAPGARTSQGGMDDEAFALFQHFLAYKAAL